MDQNLLNLITTGSCRCNKIQCKHINRLVNLIRTCLENISDEQKYLLKKELSTDKYRSKYFKQQRMMIYDYVLQKYDKEKKEVFGEFLRECKWYPYSELSKTFYFKLKWHPWNQQLIDDCKERVPFPNLNIICNAFYYRRFEMKKIEL